MKRLNNGEIKNAVNVTYNAGGLPLAFDWVRVYNEDNREYKIPYERCEACDNQTPSLEHECLICGQETKPNKPIFYQAVLKKVKGDVFDEVYPHLKGKEQLTLTERLGDENGCCSECGGNEWMLLPKECVAVKEGGKPYIECLNCGETTHL